MLTSTHAHSSSNDMSSPQVSPTPASSHFDRLVKFAPGLEPLKVEPVFWSSRHSYPLLAYIVRVFLCNTSLPRRPRAMLSEMGDE
jgi:hypothetical protein